MSRVANGSAPARAAAALRPAVPAVSVIVCTHNRAERLRALLQSVVGQVLDAQSGDAAEIIVVDNNSTDATAAVVATAAASGGWLVRYQQERRQGKSYALNAGLAAAHAAICLVLDDDQLMPPGYLARVLAIYRERPDISFLGGRVLPIWETPPPPWLAACGWSPIGMSDYGPRAFTVAADRSVCLLTFSFRKADVAAVGGFQRELGVSAGRPGSTEDAELIRRLVEAGKTGLYTPELVLHHHAPAARLTVAYYRRWYRGHGGYLAIQRDPAVEGTRWRVLGIPGHMLRGLGRDLVAALGCLLRRDLGGALRHELQLQQFLGFAARRVPDSLRRRAAPGSRQAPA